jgi:hypothetical protein
MAMNVNSLLISFGTSLRGFFEFCEEQNGVKADDLSGLFNQYFVVNGATKKAQAKKTVSELELSDSDESNDEDIFVSSSKKASAAPKKFASAKKTKDASAKAAARKPSGKGKEVKPRDEQMPVADLDLNKKKLPELKEYARERGLPVSGTKAQLIENLLNYEKEQEDSPIDKQLDAVEEADLDIQIKKPKTKNKKVCEPADKPKYEVEEKHGVKMIYHSKLDGWFVLNDKNVVVGWVLSDDEVNAEEDESVDIRALDKDVCEFAKELGLEFEVPENLDA